MKLKNAVLCFLALSAGAVSAQANCPVKEGPHGEMIYSPGEEPGAYDLDGPKGHDGYVRNGGSNGYGPVETPVYDKEAHHFDRPDRNCNGMDDVMEDGWSAQAE